MDWPRNVKIVEVGARDGLQNESAEVSTAIKIELIERLAAAGLPAVEAGAFVSPRKVPQMADSREVFQGLKRWPGTAYAALVPNMKGFEAAIEAGVTEIAVFVSASDGFSRHNIGCSRAESLERLRDVAEAAADRNIRMRGYVSCIAGCPYDGAVAPDDVAAMAEALVALGCYEISLGDTIGVGTAGQIRDVIERVATGIPRDQIAMHFHDTYGQGVANVLASLQEGIVVFDSSVAGLGGCPFAPGASGNVATEDVVYLLQGLGIETGIDLMAVAKTGEWISRHLGRPNAARAGKALLAAKQEGDLHGG
ncbi:hydroxymethylglutaryl-CoA lyase [Agrobacterium tumefaciens]|uniref:hydroxymethylglutaryl-CoA lyase n=1 Tax=Agrobacterium fabrum (strain C58 / ATCC 33970) TaxID=176299 RepID=Q7CSK6_AGRFC|nr:hydroxymethylglutaryl-CoA lyase [Agrobacterium fabrum]KEY53494.1 hydroxymethylglutaryl-CoA lyase [Agrobacterium tumefaciens]AAK89914.2 hydroxymethylglutaryl-CoA lyase [Agrobacterium fabrum str. C58]AYM59290.1 hydroxymethylglutaryl-CoA lyase [Agrobacterium fabrum]KJX86749.1 hydroxymethylglutaryl-CoA lyase [Agrobacterium tumefaciens]MCX2875671.1 hydroxymethylglutaryl-CoA lyase [Agrobacterium fabrum]